MKNNILENLDGHKIFNKIANSYYDPLKIALRTMVDDGVISEELADRLFQNIKIEHEKEFKEMRNYTYNLLIKEIEKLEKYL